jgi:hypothetical protein
MLSVSFRLSHSRKARNTYIDTTTLLFVCPFLCVDRSPLTQLFDALELNEPKEITARNQY